MAVDLEVRSRRGVRPARPQRRRQDHHRRDPRRLSRSRRRRRQRPRPRSRRTTAARCASASASSSNRRRLAAYLTVEETVEQYRGYYPRPRPLDEMLEVVGLTEERGQRANRLSGGQQRRLDVGRRASRAIPTCCFSMSRRLASTRRAPQRLGSHHEPQGARQDGAAHHALHGRSRTPRRPRGHRRARARLSPRARRAISQRASTRPSSASPSHLAHRPCPTSFGASSERERPDRNRDG